MVHLARGVEAAGTWLLVALEQNCTVKAGPVGFGEVVVADIIDLDGIPGWKEGQSTGKGNIHERQL